jgi:hypothetical protein
MYINKYSSIPSFYFDSKTDKQGKKDKNIKDIILCFLALLPCDVFKSVDLVTPLPLFCVLKFSPLRL